VLQQKRRPRPRPGKSAVETKAAETLVEADATKKTAQKNANKAGKQALMENENRKKRQGKSWTLQKRCCEDFCTSTGRYGEGIT